ncbi:MLO-like protein 4 isoform X2 [Populus alba x Populus x berolinensis]|nr:MLO-like protein 4 isoform X2 [Populus alba x Populus x berolinensis]
MKTLINENLSLAMKTISEFQDHLKLHLTKQDNYLPSFLTTHPIHGASTEFLFGCRSECLVFFGAIYWLNVKIVEFGRPSSCRCYGCCLNRQFWSSINQADYMALRLGFISKHQLPLTYDFHNYMLRSMEEEFRDIVGISAPLWIYGICCIFLEFHGTDLYFWLSFLPAILILLIGTKLHRVVVKLAVEIMNSFRRLGNRQFNLRDELFWFGKPRLLLWLIQFISFQNAFEMSTFLWSLWEINGSSCFMDNETYIVIRLVCGVVTQFWFSFITFPLYIIITQMGAKFKKTVVSENVRKSLHGWQRRVKAKQSSSTSNLLALPSTTSLGSSMTDSELSRGGSSARVEDKSAALQHQEASTSQAVTNGTSQDNETLEVSLGSGTPCYDSSSDEDDAGVHDLGH